MRRFRQLSLIVFVVAKLINFAYGAVTVSLSPASVHVSAGNQVQFNATVSGTSNSVVLWSLAGVGCQAIACGQITSTGLYTAPPVAPSPNVVTIVATSLADLSATGSAAAIIGSTSDITVSVSPSSATIYEGQQQLISAMVNGTTIQAVTWSVTCSSSSCGSVSPSGIYSAPSSISSSFQAKVLAASVADPTKSAPSVITVQPLTVSVTPKTITLVTNATTQFTATVVGSSNSAVTWKLSGAGCSGVACGTITSSGFYTAPSAVPTVPQVNVTATSSADPNQSSTAVVTVIPPVSVAISPSSAIVLEGQQQQFTATVSGTSNTSVSWSVSGNGCSGAACGTVSSSGLYTAPASVPSPPQVNVTATSAADKTKSATAVVTVAPPVVVKISPATATVAVSQKQPFTASVTGSTNTAVTWTVSGSGCTGAACGTVNSSGVYSAPPTVPSPATVNVTATSVANPKVSASAVVTVAPGVGVAVTPSTAQVGVGKQQQFTATVTGTANTGVSWSILGTNCASNACGTISSSGLYTAPATVPSPATVTIQATSAASPNSSGTAQVTVVPPVAVKISPSTVQVVVALQQQFTATVSNTTNTAVTWTLSGVTCTGSACGTIDSNGLYTAPSSLPSNPAVHVIATSKADSTKSATATVTLINPVSVLMSPQTATVATGEQLQFSAAVQGSTNNVVAWTLSGAGCSGSTCGTISSKGLYTAPSAIPSPATVTITATAQVQSSKTATATVTIIANNNSQLSGNYAIRFSGFDSAGLYQAAADFVADGSGHITSGSEDVNHLAGYSAAIPLTGTYMVLSSNRGVLNLSSSLGAQRFYFSLNGSGTRGRLIEFDGTAHAAGIIEKQASTAFSTAKIKGDYAFGLSGQNSSGASFGAVGMLLLDGSGVVQLGSIDANNGGSLSPTFGSLHGTYQVAANGRGTMTLNVPGFVGGIFHLTFYVVSATRLYILSSDPLTTANPMMSGTATLQSPTFFGISNLNGPAVLYLNGASGGVPHAMAGQIVFDGMSQIAVSLDEVTGSNVSSLNPFTGAYDVQINGRSTLSLDGINEVTKFWILYLDAPNTGYLLDGGTSAAVGELIPQTSTTFSKSTLLGNYAFGSYEPSVMFTALDLGTLNFDGASSTSGVEYTDTGSALLAGQSVAGSYSVSKASNGNGLLQLTAPSSQKFDLWIASPSTAIGIEMDPTVSTPAVLHIEQ